MWAQDQMISNMNGEFNKQLAMWALDQLSMISNKNLLRIRYKIGHVSSRAIFYDFRYELIKNSIQRLPCELRSSFLWCQARIYWGFNTNWPMWAQEYFSLISHRNFKRIQYEIGHVRSGAIFCDFRYELIKKIIQKLPCELRSSFLWCQARIYWEFNTKSAMWAQEHFCLMSNRSL